MLCAEIENYSPEFASVCALVKYSGVWSVATVAQILVKSGLRQLYSEKNYPHVFSADMKSATRAILTCQACGKKWRNSRETLAWPARL